MSEGKDDGLKPLTLRVSDDVIRKIEGYAKTQGITRSRALTSLLQRGIVSVEEGFVSDHLFKTMSETQRSTAYNRRACNVIANIELTNMIYQHAIVQLLQKVLLNQGDKFELEQLMNKANLSSTEKIDEIFEIVKDKKDTLSNKLKDSVGVNEDGKLI